MGSTSGKERRLAPRLRYRASWITEHFKLSPEGPIFAVMDLSLGGMAAALKDEASGQPWRVGQVLEGTLNLDGRKLDVQTRVARILEMTRPAYGLALVFQDLDQTVKEVLEQYLSPANLAQTLKPVPTPIGDSDPSAPSGLGALVGAQVQVHYQGAGETWLKLLRSVDGEYTAFEIELLGQVFQCDATNQIHEGTLSSEDALEFLKHAKLPSQALQWMIRKIHGSKLRT